MIIRVAHNDAKENVSHNNKCVDPDNLLVPPETKATERAWQYTVTPYIWTVSLDGEIGAQGRTTSVDADFSDLLAYVDKAFMVAFVAHSDRWSAGANYFTVGLKDAFDLRRSVIDAQVDQTIIDTFGAYRPGNWQRLRVLFGLRYYDMDTDITFSGAVINFRVTDGETWVDPVVGLAYRRPLSKKWTVDLEGDIGGFGVGADFAGNFVFGFNSTSTRPSLPWWAGACSMSISRRADLPMMRRCMA